MPALWDQNMVSINIREPINLLLFWLEAETYSLQFLIYSPNIEINYCKIRQ